MSDGGPRILVLDTDWPALDVERPAAQRFGLPIDLVEPGVDLATMPAVERRDVAGLLVQRSPVTTEVIDALPGLQVVGRIDPGVEIDLNAATRPQITVLDSGADTTEECAAHTVMMMLNLVRGLPHIARTMRAGRWWGAGDLAGVPRLSQLTLGLVGLGSVAIRVAEISSALGVQVKAYDPSVDHPCIESANSLEDLLTTTDIISLHAPLTDETRDLIGERELLQMPQGSILINVSSAGLVDEDALLWCIEGGHLSGAGLDVFRTEPLPPDHPLRRHDNIILTPHMAGYSEPALADARRRLVEEIAAVIAGERDRQ
jgi:D-3-phosphoglycerate dehydrogenase